MTNTSQQGRIPRRPRGRRRPRNAAAEILRRDGPSFDAWHIREPYLVFGGGGRCQDPKAGIGLYGPLALNGGARQTIRVGIISSGPSTQIVRRWLRDVSRTVTPEAGKKGKPPDALLAPTFPGINSGAPFHCAMECPEDLEEAIPQARIAEALAAGSAPERVAGVVRLYAERLAVLASREPEPDVVICFAPAEVEEHCRRQFGEGARDLLRWKPSKRQRAELRFQKKSESAGQDLLFPSAELSEDPRDQLDLEWDFHDALKATAMEHGLPTQLIWASTLAQAGGTQDRASIAWNLTVALYYKAGNQPWTLDGLSPGTCFVGLSFYKESRKPGSNLRTSLAQVFSETGDGLVLRGGRAQVDPDGDRQPHLSEHESKSILEDAVSLYTRHFHQKPARIVVHKTSRYTPTELSGLRSAVGDVASFDFMALERRGIRFFRLGYEPPVRGTVVQLADRDYLVYTQGYLPSIRMYPGMRVPVPLEVVEHHGDSSAERVCREILALTKLNWNTCSFATLEPITIAFARRVGSILRDMPPGSPPQLKYRYYM